MKVSSFNELLISIRFLCAILTLGDLFRCGYLGKLESLKLNLLLETEVLLSLTDFYLSLTFLAEIFGENNLSILGVTLTERLLFSSRLFKLLGCLDLDDEFG